MWCHAYKPKICPAYHASKFEGTKPMRETVHSVRAGPRSHWERQDDIAGNFIVSTRVVSKGGPGVSMLNKSNQRISSIDDRFFSGNRYPFLFIWLSAWGCNTQLSKSRHVGQSYSIPSAAHDTHSGTDRTTITTKLKRNVSHACLTQKWFDFIIEPRKSLRIRIHGDEEVDFYSKFEHKPKLTASHVLGTPDIVFESIKACLNVLVYHSTCP